MLVLKHEKLFGNLEKCTFFTHKVSFLGYVITGDGIKADESKLEAIQTWHISQSIHNARSFYGIASFYKRFIRNFSIIMTSITEVVKGISFKWAPKAQSVFEEAKKKLTQAPILAFSCFEKVFEVECDASGVGIGCVLT